MFAAKRVPQSPAPQLMRLFIGPLDSHQLQR
jgi:hypothetical protein